MGFCCCSIQKTPDVERKHNGKISLKLGANRGPAPELEHRQAAGQSQERRQNGRMAESMRMQATGVRWRARRGRRQRRRASCEMKDEERSKGRSDHLFYFHLRNIVFFSHYTSYFQKKKNLYTSSQVDGSLEIVYEGGSDTTTTTPIMHDDVLRMLGRITSILFYVARRRFVEPCKPLFRGISKSATGSRVYSLCKNEPLEESGA
jgi:hypothetical protein